MTLACVGWLLAGYLLGVVVMACLNISAREERRASTPHHERMPR